MNVTLRESFEVRKPTPVETSAERQGLAEDLARLAEQYGPEALLKLAGVIRETLAKGDKVTAQELIPVFEGLSLAEFQEIERAKMLRLKRFGSRLGPDYVVKKDLFEDPDGWRLVFRNERSQHKSEDEERADRDERLAGSKLECWLNTWAGANFYKEGAFEEAPRPLFYNPGTKDEALTIENIKQARFHFAPWEVFERGGHEMHGKRMPNSLDDVQYFEAMLACLIYHPRFGNAERDESGKLMVTYEDGTRRPIAGDFFERTGWGIGVPDPQVEGRILKLRSTPLLAIESLAPRLFEGGLLKKVDFDVRNSERKNLDYVLLGKSFRYKSIIYNLPSVWQGKNIRAAEAGDRLLFFELQEDGREALLGSCRRFQKDDPEVLKSQATPTAFSYYVRKIELDARPEKDSIEYHDSEAQRAFELAKLAALRVSDFRNELQKNGLSYPDLPRDLRHSLEQSTGALPAMQAELRGVDPGVIVEALQLSVNLAEVPELAAKVIRLMGQMDDVNRPLVLKYIQACIKNKGSILEAGQTESEARALTYAYLNSVNVFLDSLLNLDQPGAIKALTTPPDPQVIKSIFKYAFKGSSAPIDPEKLGHMTYVTQDSRHLLPGTRADILMIARANYGEKAEGGTALAELERALDERREDVSWHIIKDAQGVVAYVRYEARPEFGPGARYGGSFNVRPDMYQSAIGETLARSTLEVEARKGDVHFYGSAALPLGTLTLYSKILGGQVVDVEEGLWLHFKKPKLGTELETKSAESLVTTYDRLVMDIQSQIELGQICTSIEKTPGNTITLKFQAR